MDTLDLLPISALNQWAYCPRRFWYMHVQGEMVENVHVLQGVLDHAGVDRPGYAAAEAGIRLHRRVFVYSHTLGISGICDLVEAHPNGELVPVEYKEGRRGRWGNDQVQLCAQALCLEEMRGCAIAHGAIFYFGDRRRQAVPLTPELRGATLDVICAVARALAVGETPPHTTRRSRCRGCSLAEVCLPNETRQMGGVGSGQ